MPWYIWFLIGLFGGGTAGLFLACLLNRKKEAEEGTALLMWMAEWVAEWSMRNLELQEHKEKYVSKRWVYEENRT